ncbi:hypothetical protein HBI18_048610 [Parastagonospora nodorum]|nr:hypothetical protein HBI18_048610 [Parastagonospora nodorum]
MAGIIDDEDFNSSDIEVEPRPNPFAHFGQASLDRALAAATEDRRASKISFKQKPLFSGSPGNQHAQALWSNRFSAFRTGTLKERQETMPTCESIIRFLYAYPKHLQSRSPSGSISYITMTAGLIALLDVIKRQNIGFKLLAGESSQIKAVFQDLLERGTLTKDAYRTGMWIGSRMVFLMTKALVEDAINHGCSSWDYVLQGALSLSLMVGTGARSGDLGRSAGYKSGQCLTWGDITIKVDKKSKGIEDLECLMRLRYIKGKKDSSNVENTIRLRVLDDQFGVCDTVKLLLIMALRVGQVEETSIKDLLDTTHKRRDGVVLWKFPDHPVLKAFDSRKIQLTGDKSAPSRQLSTTLKHASSLVGMLKSPWTHDIRRGAAFEINKASSTKTVDGEVRAANLLGHSHKSTFQGITKKYIGGSHDSRHEERLTTEVESLPVDAAVQAAAPFKKAKITAAELDQYILSKNLPVLELTKVDRRKSRRAMEREMRDAWEEANNPSQFEDLEETTPTTLVPTSVHVTAQAPSRKRKTIAETTNAAEEVSGAVEDACIDPRLLGIANCLEAGKMGEKEMEEYQDMFDLDVDTPRDQAPYIAEEHGLDLSNQESIISRSSNDPVPDLKIPGGGPILPGMGFLDFRVQPVVVPKPPYDPLYAIKLPGIDFVDHFSRINLISGETTPVNGGSRDAAKTFQFTCAHGCGYQTTKACHIRKHNLNCNGIPRGVTASRV